MGEYWFAGFNFPNASSFELFADGDSFPESLRHHITQHAHLFKEFTVWHDIVEAITTSSFPNVKVIDVHTSFKNCRETFPNAEAVICASDVHDLHLPERIKTLVVWDPYDGLFQPPNWNTEYIEVLYLLPIPNKLPH